jgi:hypothetical protein
VLKAVVVVSRVLWAGTLLNAVWNLYDFGRIYVTEILMRSNPDLSAIQISEAALEALTLAVIPYVIAHAWDAAWRLRSA